LASGPVNVRLCAVNRISTKWCYLVVAGMATLGYSDINGKHFNSRLDKHHHRSPLWADSQEGPGSRLTASFLHSISSEHFVRFALQAEISPIDSVNCRSNRPCFNLNSGASKIHSKLEFVFNRGYPTAIRRPNPRNKYLASELRGYIV
jgi:hypothetical protein